MGTAEPASKSRAVINNIPITKLERQLRDMVRVIRSDGDTESASGEAVEWYRTTEIQHYTSSRYTLKLNGAADWMVRTLKEMTASLLDDSKLPSAYWSYVARYAAVILIKTSAKNPSAWTRLTERGSGIEKVHRFGQRCLVQVPREVQRKERLVNRKSESEFPLGQSETISRMINRDGAFEQSQDERLVEGTRNEGPREFQYLPKLPNEDPPVQSIKIPEDVLEKRFENDDGDEKSPNEEGSPVGDTDGRPDPSGELQENGVMHWFGPQCKTSRRRGRPLPVSQGHASPHQLASPKSLRWIDIGNGDDR